MNNSLNSKTVLSINEKLYSYFSLSAASEFLGVDLTKLPCSLKVLLENLLRNEDGMNVKLDDIKILASCVEKHVNHEISYKPARVLMQDFTGVPAIVDLASMRSYVKKNGGDPSKINPSVPVDLVIDHSIQVDSYGNISAFDKNVELEAKRNLERYSFLKWGELSFKNFRVVPPSTGICHQVNIEYLAQVVCNKNGVVYPDTVIGTDSHTTMVNGLSILGWGVGGIEAESVMLGQPISMLIPEVVGFKLTGRLSEGVTTTDLVLTITNVLRMKGVVGKFVEFYGNGLDHLSVADRATIANMAPEYGATCGFFPIDQKTLDYLSLTGRPEELIKLVEVYAKEQGLLRSSNKLMFFDMLELDLSSVKPVMAGPKRPQDKVFLSQVSKSFSKSFAVNRLDGSDKLQDGSVVIAAITSCTNTSNPGVMIAAGLVARNAVKLGIKSKPWVKTSLAPGSQVVTEYLGKSGLQKDLNSLGFNLVGYGCMTCIGNSGPLDKSVEDDIKNKNLTVATVLSGNRNFEGRIHPLAKANYLASPLLVVIYALAGTVRIDLTKDPICKDKNGNDVYLQDLWPTSSEIENCVKSVVTREMFIQKYRNVFSGDEHWQKVKCGKSEIYSWDTRSTYIQNPPYFIDLSVESSKNNVINIKNAQILAIFGDSVTTDHISPAGNIALDSPAGIYLKDLGIEPRDFNSYGSRRGNHNIMMRATFSNVRIKNEMVSIEGGYTKYIPSQETMSIFDVAMRYKEEAVPLIVIAGKEYGTGSSRDWAAKGTALLGIRAVIAESFERIHRSNLIGVGVLPLVFRDGITRKVFSGNEVIDIRGEVVPNGDLECIIKRNGNSEQSIQLRCCVQTVTEVKYLMSGGILNYVLAHSF
ncbi:aconitate hydratase AcnA [Wolbachia endosymbiont of Dirofilaria (Dirofilaria) immitis]|uniref:aconitate hydratase AcnA n=1 Tax=Wolbachia endosymbiont of Dirofilaria (Dirofilaria) immitis TaxID=1812115 RepID=UPI00158E87C8|nr:aconitate hydratase AcnA [Wolbachia endosymbiont of Dirofilaria (Dirofilaria) immitis]QKX02446.1 aconitate hydratase AcnA [Wolbachia endosymbiont of Dirofilaria (Dirofilaria) immitis]